MADNNAGRWPAIILIYALSVASAMAVSEGVPALGGIAAEFHPRSPAVVGLVMSIPALVVALGGLLTGWIVDRAGDRPMLLIGGLILLAGDAGVIVAPDVPTLLAARVVAGMGYLAMAVAAVTMMMRITAGQRRVAALALWSTVIPASFIVAFLEGALVLARGWRWVFGMHAGLTAPLLVLGVAALPRRDLGTVPVSRSAGLGLVLRSWGPYALGASFAAAAFLQSGMIAVLARLLQVRLGVGEAQVQPFGILAMVFNMVGALSVGTLINRGVKPWIIGLAGAAAAAVSTLALADSVSTLGAAIATNCVLMLGCGLLAGMWALLPRVAPSPGTMGATSGLVTQITLLGVLLGAPSAFAALGAGPGGFAVLVGVALLGTAAALPIWFARTPADAGAGPRLSPAISH
jgi:predicted MFS family arabinose efflux permease